MIYILVTITYNGKRLQAAFTNLSDAGQFAKDNNLDSWHIEEIPLNP